MTVGGDAPAKAVWLALKKLWPRISAILNGNANIAQSLGMEAGTVRCSQSCAMDVGRSDGLLMRGPAGGQALRSSELLAQLRSRNALAAAAGLAEADGDAEDAGQVCSSLSTSQQVSDVPRT